MRRAAYYLVIGLLLVGVADVWAQYVTPGSRARASQRRFTSFWIPAAGCNNATAASNWDLPTTTPAVAACVTGTNTQKGVLDYADTTGGFSAQMTLVMTEPLLSIANTTLYWTTTATANNARWTVQFVCTNVDATATDDPAFPTSGMGFNTVTTVAPGTSPRVQSSRIGSPTIPTSCLPRTPQLLHVRVFRDGNDAADTVAATTRLIGVVVGVWLVK